MKTTYIYLNTYEKGYLYVGSHTWDGPCGMIDPTYHGSSRVAEYYNWTPIKEEIIEVVGSDKLHREKYWIEKYAILYGIADCVHFLTKNNEWVHKYKKHGRMPNCHCNDAYHATKASLDRETRLKQVETKKNNKSGIFSSAAHSKTNLTRIRNGEKLGIHMHTPESVAKSLATRRKNKSFHNPNARLTKESRIKGMETRRRNAVRYEVIKDDAVVFVGTMTELKKEYCPHRLNYKMFSEPGVKIDFRDYSIRRLR